MKASNIARITILQQSPLLLVLKYSWTKYHLIRHGFELSLLQKAVDREMRWCHMWRHCAPSMSHQLGHITGNINSTPVQWGEILIYMGGHQIYVAWQCQEKRLISLHSWKQILQYLWMSCGSSSLLKHVLKYWLSSLSCKNPLLFNT